MLILFIQDEDFGSDSETESNSSSSDGSDDNSERQKDNESIGDIDVEKVIEDVMAMGPPSFTEDNGILEGDGMLEGTEGCVNNGVPTAPRSPTPPPPNLPKPTPTPSASGVNRSKKGNTSAKKFVTPVRSDGEKAQTQVAGQEDGSVAENVPEAMNKAKKKNFESVPSPLKRKADAHQGKRDKNRKTEKGEKKKEKAKKVPAVDNADILDQERTEAIKEMTTIVKEALGKKDTGTPAGPVGPYAFWLNVIGERMVVMTDWVNILCYFNVFHEFESGCEGR